MQLESGQVAVVTGGADGIGLGLATAFAGRGMNIALADIDDAALDAARDVVGALGVEVFACHTDVTDAAQVQRLADATLDRFGRVDVVCNNAGTIGKCLPIWEFERVEWEWILGVDLWGVIHGIAAFVPHLVAQGAGHVVNTASMAGLTTVPLIGPYSAAKHAVVSISETLWADLQLHAPGVGVTVLCPGPTLTRLMTEGARSRPGHLLPREDRGIDPRQNPGTFAHSASRLLSPDEVAAATLKAIQEDVLYLAPHAGALDRIAPRTDRILRDVAAIAIPEQAPVNG
jgi:NAD(P)-dependent dehydrogenase (short-subunit alcohol dehydrogenase family)